MRTDPSAAVTYTLHPAERLVVLTTSGPLTPAALETVHQRVVADPDFDPAWARLVDCRQIVLDGLHHPRVTELVAVCRRFPEQNATGKTAIVVSSVVAYGLGRMFLAYVAGGARRYQIFRTMEDAGVWLGGARMSDDG